MFQELQIFAQRKYEIDGYSFHFHALARAYIALAELHKAREIYKQLFPIVEYSDYSQVKSMIILGLAELARIRENYEESSKKCLESIAIFDAIGAKCDLAEAFLQTGLTYQSMNEIEESCAYFNKAINLYKSMHAPKQVLRVQKAMMN